MSSLVPANVPEHDAIALFVEGARQAAQRGRERWCEQGGRLGELIDEELAQYERLLREMADGQ